MAFISFLKPKNTLEEGGRLLAHFISELEPGWEVDLWI